MHHFREAKNQEGKLLHLKALRGSKLRGVEIRRTAKAFDVVGDHGAVVRDIGDDEQD